MNSLHDIGKYFYIVIMRKFIFVFVLIIVFCILLSMADFSLVSKFCQQTESLNVEKEGADFGFIKQYFNGEVSFYVQNNQVVGEYIKLNSDDNIVRLFDRLGLKINKRYFVGGIEMIEGFSAFLKYRLPNSQNNVQIAIKDGEIIIGSPIIYGSY